MFRCTPVAALLFSALWLTLAHAPCLAGDHDRTRRYDMRPWNYYGARKAGHHHHHEHCWKHERHECRAGKLTPTRVLYPNGVVGPVFDKPYPDHGLIPKARAYIYDHTYDPNSFYARGWRNSQYGIAP